MHFASLILMQWINGMRAGAVGYWPRYRYALLLVAIAALLDYASTVVFMTRDGIDHELNPGFRYAALFVGPYAGPLLGKLAQLLAILSVTLYWRWIAPYVFFTATFLYTWAAWYNIWGRDLYEPLLIAIFTR